MKHKGKQILNIFMKSGTWSNVFYFLFEFICYAGGIQSLIYFIQIAAYIGINDIFGYFWLLLGVGLVFVGIISLLIKKKKIKLPKPLLLTFWIVVTSCLLVFGIVEGLILNAASTEPLKNADYLIVLGAKVNGTRPSVILQYRIDAAAAYLLENEETVAIVSGGQGEDEGISEALAMANGLMEYGIEEERIRLEDKSTNTRENLMFSKAMMEEGKSVVITSSDYHILRATKLGERYFDGPVSGLAANSTVWLKATNYTREFFAVVKDGVLFQQ